MADNLEKERDFRSKVKGAMIYPAIVVTGMIIVAIIMMTFVIPKMLTMYEEFDAELPAVTQLLINITHLFQNYWVIMLGLLGGGIYGLRLWHKTEKGRQQLDRLVLRTPIFGDLQKKVILTNVTRTLGMLVGAGVSIIEGLNIVSETANNVIFEDALKQSAKAVEKGLPLAGTINKYDFFPPIVPQMIGVGEETGKLDEVLGRLAKHFEAESDVAVKTLTTAIEPLMMILLGVGVGFMVIAIILPIYNLTAQF
jgi:type IV pilus assembly protein PilC